MSRIRRADVGDNRRMEITCVTVDCRDPRAVASFWNDALGWGGVYRNVVLRDVEGNEFCLGAGELPA